MAAKNEGLGRKILPLKTRKAMYHRVLELRRLGLSHRRIIKVLKEEYGDTVYTMTISY